MLCLWLPCSADAIQASSVLGVVGFVGMDLGFWHYLLLFVVSSLIFPLSLASFTLSLHQ